MIGLCIRELQAATGGRLSLGMLPPLSGASEPLGRIVARLDDVRPGDVYWDAANLRAAGAANVEAAFYRGAQGGVAGGPHAEPWAGRFSLAVGDPRQALLELIARARREFRAPVIAVVGQVGKSTTLHLIRTALEQAESIGAEADETAAWDVRLARLANALHGPAVPILVEIGAEPGRSWQEQLTSLAPDVVVVISPPADEPPQGDGAADKASTRLSLIQVLDQLSHDCFVVMNGEDERLRRTAEYTTARTVLVGRSSHCDLLASDVQCRDGWLTCRVEGQTLAAPLWGRHQVASLLAAYAVGRIVRRPPAQVLAALQAARPLPSRCEVIHTSRFTLINDAGDDRAETMRPALELLRDIQTNGRKIVVCGELDVASPVAAAACHQVGEEIVSRCGADWLVAWGAQADELAHAARDAGLPAGRAVCCRNVRDGQTRLASLLGDGDVVLVKGDSASMRQLVAQLVAQNESVPGEVPPPARGLRESRATLPPG